MIPKFKRVLLKLSGESLMGDKNFGLDSQVISRYAKDIKSIIDLGVQVAIVGADVAYVDGLTGLGRNPSQAFSELAASIVDGLVRLCSVVATSDVVVAPLSAWRVVATG